MRWQAAALAAISVAGCSPKPATVTLSRIIIDAPAEFDGAERSRDELRAAIEERLAADRTVKGFVSRPDATHRLRIKVHELMEVEERKVRPVEIELHALSKDPSFSTVGRGGADEDLVAAAVLGFDEGWPVLTRIRTLELRDDGALIEALADPDARIRGYAIDELGERGAGSAVPFLVARLSVEDKPELVLRTVGSLVAIGDESAVEPLIDMTRQRDPSFVLQIVFAVSAIGGRTAEGFLVTLASGHPHPAIQKGAKDALDEMRRRQGGARDG